MPGYARAAVLLGDVATFLWPCCPQLALCILAFSPADSPTAPGPLRRPWRCPGTPHASTRRFSILPFYQYIEGVLWGCRMMKRFADLSEQEILALAITNEEEDSRIYLGFAEGLRERC